MIKSTPQIFIPEISISINRERKTNKMKLSLANISDRKIKIIIYFIFAITTVVLGIQLSLPYVLDEVGTVANTAFMAGDDWSLCVQTMGGFYYKYGFSALYLPLYLIFKSNPVLMYKAMISLNMLIISFIPVISYHICRNYLNIKSKLQALLISVPAVGISSIWLYSAYSRCDVILIFLPWPILLLLLKLSSLEKSMKKNILSVLLAFITVYAYMTHTRGLVLIVAALLTIIIMSVLYKKHIVNYFLYLPATGIFLVVDKILASIVKQGVYGKYGTRHGSMEALDYETLGKLFTQNGIVIELKLCIGWLYNLFTSTMGLVIIGFIAAFIILYKNFKKRQENTGENILSIFSILCLMGTFAMGAIFFFPSAFELMNGFEIDRADRMVYGRYTVGAVGLLAIVALYSLIIKKDEIIRWKSKIVTLITYLAIFIPFIWKVSPHLDNIPQTDSRYFLSLTGLLKIENGKTTDAFPDLTSVFTKAGIISFIVLITILLLTSINQTRVLYSTCILIFLLSVINYSYVFINVRDNRDNVVYERVEYLVNYMNELCNKTDIDEEYPNFCYDKSGYLVKVYQYGLPKFNLGTLKYLGDRSQDSFFVLCGKKKIDIAIKNCNEYYGTKDTYYTLNDYDVTKSPMDVVIVKGDALADTLKSHGYALTKYTTQ